MSPACCAPKGLRKIRVGDTVVGVTGLDAVLAEAVADGLNPESAGTGVALLQRLREAGNYVEPGLEAEYVRALMGIYREHLATRHHEAGNPEGKERTVKIEILGPGCTRCRATEENVRKALAELKQEGEVEHITDPREFARRGVLLTPGVIIEGKVMCSGRVPEVNEIKKWLGGS